MENSIKNILMHAVRAPSGDNSQPWRFELSGNTLKVYALVEKDNGYLNVAGIGTYMAVGALIKNISIATPKYGLAATITFSPDPGRKDLAAIIIFENGETREDPLFSAIDKRSTNRRPYKPDALPETYLKQAKEAGESEGITVTLVTDKEKMQKAARGASSMEETAFQVPELRKIFFDDLVWTEKEEREKKTGLYLKTLEVPPPVTLIFKLWRKPKIANFFKSIGLPTKVAEQNAATYAKAGALGLISFPDDTPTTALKAGMVFQDLWLRTIQENMYLQPICGTLFLSYKLKRDGLSILDEKQKSHILAAATTINESFGAPAGIPLMLFRIGYAKPPSARTSRFPVESLYKV